MTEPQRSERRSDRMLPKRNWRNTRREYLQSCLFLLDSIALTKLYMDMLKAEDKRMEKQRSEERKKRENYFRLHEKVEKIREKSLLPEKWNSSELATMIQWHRHKGDAKIPTTVAERRQRYLDVCGRGDPPLPELVTADENDIAAADAGTPEADATAAAGDFVIAAADAGDVAIAASVDDSSDASVIRHEV